MDAAALHNEFEENGVVTLRGLLSPAELAEARRCYEKQLHEPTSKYPASTYTDGSMYNPASGFEHELGLFQPLLQTSRILQAVTDLWGSSENVWCIGTEIFYKKHLGAAPADEDWVTPGRDAARSYTPMHQDTRVIPFFGAHVANVWISFEELPEENSLQVVKGSHRGPLYDASDILVVGLLPAQGGKGAAPIVREVVPPPEEFGRKGWEVFSPRLSPGDVVVFHPGCIHGGGPCSARVPERSTLVFRFFGDDCLYRDDLGPFSTIMYGKEQPQLEFGEHYSLRGGADHLLGPGLPAAKKAKL